MEFKKKPRVSYQWSTGIPLLPFFFLVGFFLFWPIAVITIKSLQSNSGQWTLSNYTPIIHKGPYLHSFITSLKLSTITSMVSSTLGAFMAYVIAKYAGKRLTGILDSISAVFANSGGVQLSFMFIAAFGVEGFATKFLKKLGWNIYAGNFTIFSFTGIVITYAFFLLPLMVIVFKPAIKGLRPEWLEASISLGASNFTYWRRVGIPMLAPSFIGAFFLLFAGSFSAYATAQALTAGSVPLVPIIIGTLINGNVISNEANLGDSLAVGMIIVAGIAMMGYLFAQRMASRGQRQ